MEVTRGIDRVADMSLREITEIGGEHMLYQRLTHDVQNAPWTDEQKQHVLAAAQQAIDVYHHGDLRDDQSYATHVLRVACRLLSPHHFNIQHDYRLIIAAILHDVIENRPERLLNEEPLIEPTLADTQLLRDRALQAIADTYDPICAQYVQQISNPIYDRTDLTIAQRHDIYSSHINTLFDSDSPARYIKLSDFIDNCLGLEYNPDQQLRCRLARKYLPLLPRMVSFVLSSDIAATKKDSIIDELFYAHELCKTIITTNGQIQQLGISSTIQSQTDDRAEQWRTNRTQK